MRPWLAFFLLIFFSLQSTWSMAATYCQHEAAPAAFHFGHHEHQHQADDRVKDGPGQLADIDSDCANCHASCAAIVVSIALGQVVAGGAADHPWFPHVLTSPPGDQPERPNWSISA